MSNRVKKLLRRKPASDPEDSPHFSSRRAVRSGAPIIQSLILLAIYMLLPLGLVFSSYSGPWW